MMPELKKRGTRFEIWLEKLLCGIGASNLMRDVEYHKKRYVFRQIDLSYNYIEDGKIYLAIVEAKFSSKKPVPYDLREGEIKRNGQVIPRMDNLITKLREAQKFVGAKSACLVTNKRFEERVGQEAKEYGIKILERPQLEKMYEQVSGHSLNGQSIDASIKSIDLGKHRLTKNIVYV